jgi:ketosteroid isomerase-like protein
MKKSILLSLMFVTITSSAQSGDRAQILKVLSDQVAAWNTGDIDLFMKLGYWNSDSLAMIGRSGVTYGYQQVLNNYKKNYSDQATMGNLKFDILQVKKIAADYYFVIGKWFLTRTAGDVGGHYTLLFKKIKGRWLIVADHSS